MDLTSASEELYSGLPEDFVARRKELARQARADKDRPLAQAIEALRRPSRGAWLVNLLARHATDSLTELFDLAPLLAEMHTTGTPEQLRELGGLRRRTVMALVQRAVELAGLRGHHATDATRWEVQTTLEAALAHPEAARQVLAGCLVATPESAASFPLELFSEPGQGLGAGRVTPATKHSEPATIAEPAGQSGPEAAAERPVDEQPVAPVIDLAAAARQKAARERVARLRRAEGDVARVQAELETAERTRDQASEREAGVRREVEQADGQLQELGREAEQVAAERAELESRLAALAEREQELAARRAEAEALAERHRAEAEQAATEAAHSDEVARGVAERLTELTAALTALQAERD
ncbi:hypothetical protein [Luteococcus peritonei]|uniref:Transposase n=1 Tax=Luteococcus peritonei TaxID=88874 RepID=A0ABW4RUF6_9ACTN